MKTESSVAATSRSPARAKEERPMFTIQKTIRAAYFETAGLPGRARFSLPVSGSVERFWTLNSPRAGGLRGCVAEFLIRQRGL